MAFGNVDNIGDTRCSNKLNEGIRDAIYKLHMYRLNLLHKTLFTNME